MKKIVNFIINRFPIGFLAASFVYLMIKMIGVSSYNNLIFIVPLIIVLAIAYYRAVLVILLSIETMISQRKFVKFKWGWAETLTSPEPILLLIVTYYLHVNVINPASVKIFSMPRQTIGSSSTTKILCFIFSNSLFFFLKYFFCNCGDLSVFQRLAQKLIAPSGF